MDTASGSIPFNDKSLPESSSEEAAAITRDLQKMMEEHAANLDTNKLIHAQGEHADIHRAMYVDQVLDDSEIEESDKVGVAGPFGFAVHIFHKTRNMRQNKLIEEAAQRQDNIKRYLLAALGEQVLETKEEEDMKSMSPYALKYLKFSMICKRIAENGNFVTFVTFIIILAGIVVGFQTDPRIFASPKLVDTLNGLNVLILAVFTLECALKIIGFGLNPLAYFKDGWNKFDFLIVVGSYVPGAGSLLIILRLLRLLRVLKLVRSLPQLAVILNAMMLGLGSIGYIGLILFLVFYVFAILGLLLFSANDPWHFGSLHMAMITLFRIATLDAWAEVMYVNMFGCNRYPGDQYSILNDKEYRCRHPNGLGIMAVLYFVLFVIIGSQVILTLFIGVVTTSMDQVSEAQKSKLKLEERVARVAEKYELAEWQTDNFRECFDLLDLDKGGTIEEEELKIGLAIVGSQMPDEEISRRMKEADPSVEGVDLVGFILFMVSLPKFKQRRMFLKVLRLYRTYIKKKKAAALQAKFLPPSIMHVLHSPRSLMSPRSWLALSPRTQQQHEDAHIQALHGHKHPQGSRPGSALSKSRPGSAGKQNDISGSINSSLHTLVLPTNGHHLDIVTADQSSHEPLSKSNSAVALPPLHLPPNIASLTEENHS